jgi:hypothetical protein
MSSRQGLLGIGSLAITLAGRVLGHWLRRRLEQSIESLDDAGLARLCAATDWRMRRARYDVAIRNHRVDVAHCWMRAEHHSDLVVRLWSSGAAIHAAVAAGGWIQFDRWWGAEPRPSAQRPCRRSPALARFKSRSRHSPTVTRWSARSPKVRLAALGKIQRRFTETSCG